MKLLKTSTLLLCMTASGCSYFQTQDASSQPAKAPAEQASSHSWWPFGKDDGQTVAKQATEQKAEAEHVGSSHWWWPFGKDEGGRDVAAKAAEQKPRSPRRRKKSPPQPEPKAANPLVVAVRRQLGEQGVGQAGTGPAEGHQGVAGYS
ncbi:putative outer membrane protein [Pseudomonas aeruginosa]|nr:putative outer membrane protein [Pseudomonas aeruginosa]